jgi:hypothetical protein
MTYLILLITLKQLIIDKFLQYSKNKKELTYFKNEEFYLI